ncbi:MAG: hypothetical protein Q4C12_09040, partial [Clostridia bacterium]|nr:hypothetical protein [Clostridia bacterium]
MKPKAFLTAAYKTALIIAVFICAIVFTKSIPVNYLNFSGYATSDVLYANGETAHFDDKNFGEVNKGDVVTIHLSLPEQHFMEDAALVFYDFNAVTEVWCDGILLESYGEELAAKGMMIGNHDFSISVPDSAWGGEITIILRATESPAFSNFTSLRVYPAQYAYQYYYDGDPLGFVVTLVLFVFGLVGLCVCALGRIRSAVLTNGVCLSLTILLVSLWMIANKGLYNIFQLDYYFWQPLEYIVGYAIPIPLLLFFRNIADKKSKWHKAFGITALIAAAFLVVTTVLNFTNILHYDSFMTVASVLILFSGVMMMVYSLQRRSDGGKKFQLLRIGMYIFIPTCLYDTFLRSLYRVWPLPIFHNLPSLITIGILFLFMYMAGAFICDLFEKQSALSDAKVKADTLNQVIDSTSVGICQLAVGDTVSVVAANNIFYKL